MLQLLSNTVTTPIFTLRQSVAIVRALADIAAEDANSTDDEAIILKFREIFSTLLTDAQQNSILDTPDPPSRSSPPVSKARPRPPGLFLISN